MPLYEYTCQSCRQDFELLVRGSERPECPECGSPKLAKRLSVPAAHVAGASSLPVCQPSGGGCALPQCGSGGCGMGF
jgi:putative FmdB family regulatory protein